MSTPTHLLDDIGDELRRDDLRKKRATVGIVSGVLQIGLAVLLITRQLRWLSAWIGFMPLVIGGVALYLQWRYRTPKSPKI